MGLGSALRGAFRRLFESTSDRELRRAQAIGKTEAIIEQARKRAESHARRYREKAVEALRLGAKGTYEALKRDLRRSLAAERRLAELQLAFSGAVQRLEETRSVAEFCAGMRAVSESLRDAFRGIDLSSALKNFATVVNEAQNVEEQLDVFLRLTSQLSIGAELTSADDVISDKDLDEMLQREALLAEKGRTAAGFDEEISKEMQEIEKLRKELGNR